MCPACPKKLCPREWSGSDEWEPTAWCCSDRSWRAGERLQFFKNTEQHINTKMKIYKAKPRQCHKIHSGSIANVSVIKILLVLPKVISLAARSHLARDGIRGLLWALNMISPVIRSVIFGCLFRSCLFWITFYVFIYKVQIYTYMDTCRVFTWKLSGAFWMWNHNIFLQF